MLLHFSLYCHVSEKTWIISIKTSTLSISMLTNIFALVYSYDEVSSMNNNICKFIHTARAEEAISILHFVYEKEAAFKEDFITSSAYAVALVMQGEGRLHTSGGSFGLEPGAVFFTYSAKPYYIENINDLQYIYISFIGLRASGLLERLPVSYAMPVVYNMGHLTKTWTAAFDTCDDQNADLFCEGLLLYTLAHLCKSEQEENTSAKPSGILSAKQYVDANYTDPKLDLRSVSQRFSYDSKYFSAAFKSLVRVGFSDYLRERRLNHATFLIQSGITNVSDLAELCGYSDPFYFSKCFKKKYGLSPKKWLSSQSK